MTYMQSKLIIKDNKLVVTPLGINKITSLKQKLEIPLNNVLGASVDEGILNENKGIKAPGTELPGYYWVGDFTKDGEKSFFNIKKGNPPVVIQLKNEKYSRLILGVDNPEEIVKLINNKIF